MSRTDELGFGLYRLVHRLEQQVPLLPRRQASPPRRHRPPRQRPPHRPDARSVPPPPSPPASSTFPLTNQLSRARTGKYQLEVYPDVGHCVHEDAPERTAETLLSFWERNDRTDVLRGVKKVGEL